MPSEYRVSFRRQDRRGAAPAPILRKRNGNTFKLWGSPYPTAMFSDWAIDRLLMRLNSLTSSSQHGTASPAVFRGCGGKLEFHQGRGKAAFGATLPHAPDPKPRGRDRCASIEPIQEPGGLD